MVKEGVCGDCTVYGMVLFLSAMTGNAGREWGVWQYVNPGAVVDRLCPLVMACDLCVNKKIKKLFHYMFCFVLLYSSLCKKLGEKGFFP